MCVYTHTCHILDMHIQAGILAMAIYRYMYKRVSLHLRMNFQIGNSTVSELALLIFREDLVVLLLVVLRLLLVVVCIYARDPSPGSGAPLEVCNCCISIVTFAKRTKLETTLCF